MGERLGDVLKRKSERLRRGYAGAAESWVAQHGQLRGHGGLETLEDRGMVLEEAIRHGGLEDLVHYGRQVLEVAVGAVRAKLTGGAGNGRLAGVKQSTLLFAAEQELAQPHAGGIGKLSQQPRAERPREESHVVKRSSHRF